MMTLKKAKARIDLAFTLIQKCNTVTILSLGEMESIVIRAIEGEFDEDLVQIAGD
jgi:hypothetical protein